MQSSELFDNFLEFEQDIFRDFLAAYDPYLIRYGEYRFVLDALSFQPGETVLDLGCERNIFTLYLATLGLRVTGVDINPDVWQAIQKNQQRVEQVTGRKLDVTFRADDATQLSLEPESVDKVIAISSVEHMYSESGHGDQLAIASIARVLKPGGMAVVSLPMTNGGPFHESPNGDERFAGPYRLYTPEVVEKRILSQSELAKVKLCYLAHTSPEPRRFSHFYFFRFWMDGLMPDERLAWAWANPWLAEMFNPIISQEEGDRRLDTVNTVLICLQKRGSKSMPLQPDASAPLRPYRRNTLNGRQPSAPADFVAIPRSSDSSRVRSLPDALNELQKKYDLLQEHFEEIWHGRVMRLLNWIHRITG